LGKQRQQAKKKKKDPNLKREVGGGEKGVNEGEQLIRRPEKGKGGFFFHKRTVQKRKGSLERRARDYVDAPSRTTEGELIRKAAHTARRVGKTSKLIDRSCGVEEEFCSASDGAERPPLRRLRE